jgi:transcriptional regulator with XRE-family HTH domain
MALTTTAPAPGFGDRLRHWRQQRRFSQLDLAHRAEVSARHLSFLETGRSRPSREMVGHLAEQLDLPLRDRNELLTAAGFAPTYRERSLDDDDMTAVHAALVTVLDAHQPYPALVVDGHWDLLRANDAASFFLRGVAPDLLGPPLNVVRISTHPEGLAPLIVNFDEYATHMVARLQRQYDRSGDASLGSLLDEVRGHLVEAGTVLGDDPMSTAIADVTLPLRVRVDDGVLSLFSTISVFGAPNDVTLDELAVEAFYPADEHTADWFGVRS